jgi:hypothetical protein
VERRAYQDSPHNEPGGLQVIHVETLGKGVAAVLILGVIAAVFFAGMAYQRTQPAVDALEDVADEQRIDIEHEMEIKARLKVLEDRLQEE